MMKEKVLEKGPVVASTTNVTTTSPTEVTVNKAIIKKDVTKGMAVETKKAVAKTINEEKKEAVKAEAAKVVETKKAAPKKEAAKKETVKKEAVKKAPAKAAKKEVFVQFGNREISTEEALKKVEAAYVAEGHKLKAEDSVRVYIKPEENMLYYVVNDSYASGINLFD